MSGNSKEESFVIVTDVQSVERMLTNAEIDYEPELSVHGHIELIRTNGVKFYFNGDGELENMGDSFNDNLAERSTKGVF